MQWNGEFRFVVRYQILNKTLQKLTGQNTPSLEHNLKLHWGFDVNIFIFGVSTWFVCMLVFRIAFSEFSILAKTILSFKLRVILNSLNSFSTGTGNLGISNSSFIFVFKTVTALLASWTRNQTLLQLDVVSTEGPEGLDSSFEGVPEERVHNIWAMYKQALRSEEKTYSK